MIEFHFEQAIAARIAELQRALYVRIDLYSITIWPIDRPRATLEYFTRVQIVAQKHGSSLVIRDTNQMNDPNKWHPLNAYRGSIDDKAPFSWPAGPVTLAEAFHRLARCRIRGEWSSITYKRYLAAPHWSLGDDQTYIIFSTNSIMDDFYAVGTSNAYVYTIPPITRSDPRLSNSSFVEIE